MAKKVLGKIWLNLRLFDKTLFKEVVHTSRFQSEAVHVRDRTVKHFSQIFTQVSHFVSVFSQYVSNILVEGLTQKYFHLISKATSFNEAFKVGVLWIFGSWGWFVGVMGLILGWTIWIYGVGHCAFWIYGVGIYLLYYLDGFLYNYCNFWIHELYLSLHYLY